MNDPTCTVCYQPWKIIPSRRMVVPSNSRPIPQPRRWHAPARPMPGCLSQDASFNFLCESNNIPIGVPSINHDDYISGAGWVARRYITGASKNSQGVWYSAAPNPIKHWRRQLFPRQNDLPGAEFNVPSERNSISQGMDRPGGTVVLNPAYNNIYWKGKGSCDGTQPPNTLTASVNIKEDIPSKNCEIHCNTTGTVINKLIRTNTSFSKDYHRSSKTYLQSRTKLYRQRATFQYNKQKNTINISEPNTFESLYPQDASGCFNPIDCSCIVQIIYKPRNTIFARNNPVAGGLYAKYRANSTVTQNQYNVTNKWGLDGTGPIKDFPLLNNKLQVGRKKPASGSGPLRSCCLDSEVTNISPIIYQLSAEFKFLIKTSTWNDILNIPVTLEQAVPVMPGPMDISAVSASTTHTLVTVTYWYGASSPGFSIVIAGPGGFSMNDVLGRIGSSRFKTLPYDIEIVQWGGIPFSTIREYVGSGYQFNDYNTGNNKSWIGSNTAPDFPVFLIGTSLEGAFNSVQILDSSYGNIADWDTTEVVDMQYMFNSTRFIGNGPVTNISKWNVSSVTNMRFMFHDDPSFNILDLSNWDVDNVTDMQDMFSLYDQLLNDLWTGNGLNTWHVNNVANMEGMFSNCRKFDEPLNNWHVDNVKNMDHMFKYTNSFNQNISAWNTISVTDMYQMFYNASTFNGGLAAGMVSELNWNTSSVANMNGMFYNAAGFNGNITNWHVSKVTDMTAMFYGASTFKSDISGWITNEVRDMHGMFFGATGFNHDLTPWNVSKVTDMNEMFRNAQLFDPYNGLDKWDISGVINMRMMFAGAKNFNGWGLSNWQPSRVINLERMFDDATSFDQDLHKWGAYLKNSSLNPIIKSMFKGTPIVSNPPTSINKKIWNYWINSSGPYFPSPTPRPPLGQEGNFTSQELEDASLNSPP